VSEIGEPLTTAAITIGYPNTGFQGTGVYVVVYSVGKGCSIMNTQTGQITCDWGQIGSMSTHDRFTLHDSFMTKSDGWAMLGRTKCLSSSCARGPYFWQVGNGHTVWAQRHGAALQRPLDNA